MSAKAAPSRAASVSVAASAKGVTRMLRRASSAASASIRSRSVSMQRIIKNGQIIDETWHLLPKVQV